MGQVARPSQRLHGSWATELSEDPAPMPSLKDRPGDRVKVRDTELTAGDSRERYREKIARITLDSKVQFVGLLDR